MNFEVGDIVEYIGNPSMLLPKHCTIKSITKDIQYGGGYKVTLHEAHEGSTYSIDSFKCIKVRNTRLARRMYPNWRGENGWLYPKIS